MKLTFFDEVVFVSQSLQSEINDTINNNNNNNNNFYYYYYYYLLTKCSKLCYM